MKAIELTPEHPPDRVASLAARAEGVGFETVFASCHYFNRDPFQTLTRVAAETDFVTLGPGVLNPYESHPVTLASQAATLDEISDGRAVFGVGAGDRSTLSALGFEHDRPLARVHETVQVVRALWAGERVDHDGVITVRDAELNLEARELPVFVGAQGPQMLRMAAAIADGVLVNAAHPDDLAWASDQLDEGDERRERPGSATRLAFASVSVAPDGDAAREAARPPVAFIVGGTAAPVLERHGIDPEAATVVSNALEAGDLHRAFERVTPAMIDAFCVAGDPEAVTDRLAAIQEHVDGVVVGSPLGPDLEQAVELASEALDD